MEATSQRRYVYVCVKLANSNREGLNKTRLHKLLHFKTWSTVGGAVWEVWKVQPGERISVTAGKPSVYNIFNASGLFCLALSGASRCEC